jgi:hypothetical protein
LILPNFLIIGVQKAATTWFAKNLGEHPDIFIVDQKEIHFFNRHFEKGVDWYAAQFKNWSGQRAIGEATPGYIFYKDIPAKIHTTLGDKVKLILSLRHPVDRAYSAFWMFLSRGIVPADSDFRTLFYQGDHGFLKRGYYFEQLSRYLDYFPRENLLIQIYEEMKQNSQQALLECLTFLDVDSQFLPDTLNEKANKRIGMSMFHYQIWGLRRSMRMLPRSVEKPLSSFGRHFLKWWPSQKKYEPLAEDLRQELFNEYKSDIEQLENLLDRDLSIWFTASDTKNSRLTGRMKKTLK